MCQPKPGPRCSAHARATLDQRRTVKDRAETAHHAAQAALRACNPADRETYQSLRQATNEAAKKFRDATDAHSVALRTYETTPEGIAALEQAATTLEEGGGETAAAEVRRRLDEAKATRVAQVADLAMSRRHAARLAAPSPDELAALDQCDAEVTAMERALEVRAEQYRQAQAEAAAVDEAIRASEQADMDAQRAVRDALAAAINAREEATAEAKRLYVEAGIADRFAGYYAADMSTAASRAGRPQHGYDRHTGGRSVDEGPQRPMSVKVKRDGPDRDKTLAAKAAAETDEAFKAANGRMVEAALRHHVAKQDLANLRRTRTGPARDSRQRALATASVAKYAMEDDAAELDRANTAREDLRARIGSGLGIATLTTLNMERVRDEVVRNPDGTTNAYVYNAPSDGFPHGRYIPVTGVTTVHGMGAANALVLENGRKAWMHGHYSRTTRGAAEQQSGCQTVVVAAAHDGAAPLRNEAVATAGFYTFIDSTD